MWRSGWWPLGGWFVVVCWTPVAFAGEAAAWVSRERALELRNVLTLDHGSYRSPDGGIWVAVRGSERILGTLPAEEVRGRRLVPMGPPPDGYSLPDGAGSQRLRAAAASSDSAGVVDIGTSFDGRQIQAAWFGRPPEDGEPSLWVLGAHHGDEAPSYELALWLAERLGQDASLQDRTVWVVPYVNPDGATRAERRNSERTDLNRNYGEQWTSEEAGAGAGPFSAPESRAMRALADLVRPVAGLALHAGAENIGYVWNYTESPALDSTALISAANAYAEQCPTEDLWVTNGASWYVTHGDSNDWSYRHYGTWEFTAEVSKLKLPPLASMADVLDCHGPSVWDFVHRPLNRVVVVDAATGRPLEAQVTIDGGQPRWTLPTSGVVGFPVGAVSISVVAEGYTPASAVPGERVALERTSALELADPPWILRRGRVRWPGVGATRWLHRRGEESIRIDVDADGSSLVVPDRFRRGWWSVEDETGFVYPRAIGMGASMAADGLGGIWVSGVAAESSRAFQRDGSEVEVVEQGDGVAIAHPGPIWLWTAGDERLLVTSDPASMRETVVVQGVGCAHGVGMGHLGPLLVSIVVGLRRRPTRSSPKGACSEP